MFHPRLSPADGANSFDYETAKYSPADGANSFDYETAKYFPFADMRPLSWDNLVYLSLHPHTHDGCFRGRHFKFH